ncbi:MAG: hypothetical protein A2086_06585 [Spirochaetes bacterium GWD1_27_9]|nr:MAG: hypothetical protein A2Z98_15725 [Spirochaetes bacterium GWB1_27_13]OHD26364.1 MAG: hypothetical protein A2Y34_05710 [Spirochaetes bacterium GWC1_27_15]OHD41306.1 MAG: hypothetical protein A2086_06585 [Spirochaetes bacterium GWD1_27_9]
MRKKFKVLLFFIFTTFIYFNMYSEEINFTVLNLSIEECVDLAEKTSYDVIKTQIDKENLDISLISNWFAYLPDVTFSLDDSNRYNYVGEEKKYQLPDNYKEQTSSNDNTLRQKIKFSQKIFDSSTIDLIIDSKNHKIKKEILVDQYKLSIRYLVRQLYYETLVFEEQLDYYIKTLELFKNTGATNGIEGLFSADNTITKLNIEKNILWLESKITENKLSLLSTLRRPLTKKLILTTPLKEIVLNKENDIKLALEKNIIIKNKYIDIEEQKKDYVLNFMNFFPNLNIGLDSKFADNLTLGVNFNMQGKSINAAMSGEYLLYDYNNYYYVSKIDDYKYNYENKKTNDWDFGNFNLSIIGSIDLDKLANTGLSVKRLKNEIIKYETDISSYKDSVILSMEKLYLNIKKISKNIQILTAKIDYIKQKKDLIDKGNIPNDINKVEYYETQNKLIIDYIEQLYAEKNNLYDEYCLYYQKIDGK